MINPSDDKKEFEQKRTKNTSFSLRAFSRYLGIDSSNLSKIMKGQLLPRTHLKNRLALKLGMTEQEIKSLEDRSFYSFDLDTFDLVSDWYHFAILELLKTKDAQSDANWIAQKLNLPIETTSTAIQRLIKCSLLSLKDGVFTNLIESSSSTLQVSTSTAHRNQQKGILQKAIEALDEIPVEFRSQSSMIMAIDKTKLAEARTMIKEFRRNLEKILSDSENLDDVYQLSVSLFPVTTSYQEN